MRREDGRFSLSWDIEIRHNREAQSGWPCGLDSGSIRSILWRANLMDHRREPGALPELTRPISFLLVICKQQAPELEPTSAMPPLPQPPLAPTASLTPAQGTPSMDELIQQSQWSLQQQEQHLLALRQVCLHVVSVTLESPSSRSVGHPQA